MKSNSILFTTSLLLTLGTACEFDLGSSDGSDDTTQNGAPPQGPGGTMPPPQGGPPGGPGGPGGPPGGPGGPPGGPGGPPPGGQALAPTPPAPPVRPELFELGQALAFDKELSGNRDIACLTCHHPALGTDDDRVLSSGVGADGLGEDRSLHPVIPRNAPALFNLHAARTMFWDNRVRVEPNGQLVTPAGTDLTPEMESVFEYGVVSAQAMFPVTSREEMRGDPGENELADLADDDFQGIWTGLMDRLGAIPEYRDLFEAAYPGTDFDDMTFAHAANAIAGYEIEAFESRGSRVERFLRGEIQLAPNEMAGMAAFGQDGCIRCHSGPGGSDWRVHNTAMVQIGPGTGDGPSGMEDRGAGGYRFRTSPLWNITLTAPYGHSGAFDDLGAFVAHYDNPTAALMNYDPADHLSDPAFDTMHFTGSDAAIAAQLSPLLQGPGDVRVPQIVDFLQAFEDPAASNLEWTIPDTVPSGLPVD